VRLVRSKYEFDMSDSELIKKCLAGEAEEYRKLMDKYSGKAMALAINILRSREDAEDACQDAFLRAYNHLPQFDLSASFKSWFYAILYNRCLDLVRKKKRSANFLEKYKKEPGTKTLAAGVNPGSTFPYDHRLLKELSPKERLTLYLWAEEGYTSGEIASVLKCSPSTARVHLFKSRKKIKAILERENVAMQNS
jgi:RNA polymerase sigma-70 factor (ECF subfamily)